mmetsp:Transcript_15873/g.47347  ORF Transcript_15873/g.47347 Transcript_15873/m.47347 type:complete len:351 (-) Transcript_15873:38-1090(-)
MTQRAVFRGDTSPQLPLHSARRRRPRRYPKWCLLACPFTAVCVLAALRPRVDRASEPLRGSARWKQAGRILRSEPLAVPQDAAHLVIVAGHAVTMTESLEGVGDRDGAWYLLDYQRGRGLPREFVRHAEAGARLVARDPQAVLVFSGGQTRPDAGPRSEAQSYWLLSEHFDWWRTGAGGRAVTEEFARDSFENLLFSLCRFKEVAGAYPQRVTVVSFDFKERRFVELHAPALGLPPAHFDFAGVAPRSPKFDADAAAAGEAAAAAAFRADPYGCAGDLWTKKRARDPFHRAPPYAQTCPELSVLFEACGRAANASKVDFRRLPWFVPHITRQRRTVAFPPRRTQALVLKS